ncbi:MAG: hypothetical protein GQF41_3061 [Candidatus Rifleibacterium amylolyticum]|nr:MAG: hypothetical protein GQF41_3061 [Candidatus Rifleibacterium amylolyticum]
MSLLKTWKRQILRNLQRKVASPGVINKAFRSIATGIAGLGMLASANCAFGQGVGPSNISPFGDTQSTTVHEEPGQIGNTNYHITTQTVSGANAFNSFSSFNLATNDTANFYLPNGTTNLINFVKSRIEIYGTVNAIKDHKIGGNLFFLSSQGLILGSSGVVNCGALFAITPTDAFMDRFVGGSNLVIDGNTAEIGQITSRQFVNRNNMTVADGVPINADGSIVIGGRVNAIDNVGAYAGSVTLENGARIDTGVTDFSALVNLDNIWEQTADGEFAIPMEGAPPGIDVSVSNLAMTTNEDGNVELVAIADNREKAFSTAIGENGYSSHTQAAAEAEVLVQGAVNAKRNATFEATAVNGTLSDTDTIVEYGDTRELKTFFGAKPISLARATVEVDATARINADNDVALHAFATNVYKSSTGPLDLGLNIAGMLSPVNISAETAVIESKAEVKVNQGSIVTAKKNIDIKSLSETDVIVGVSTSLAKIVQTPGGAAAGVVFAEADSAASVEINGTLNAGVTGDATSGDIVIDALSINALDATAAAKTGNDPAVLATGIVVGKVSNKSDVKINNSAVVNARRKVTGKATTRSDVSTAAIVQTGDDSYGGVAINFTDFNSSANVNVAAGISAPDNIDLSACNLVLQNRTTAKGTVGHTKMSQAVANLQSSLVAGIFSLSKFTSKFTGPLESTPSKFRAAGAIAINRGSHDAGLKLGENVKLSSGNDLSLKSSSVIEDIFVQADSVARSTMNDADGAKVSVSAGIIYSDVSQNSSVQIADASYDSTTGNGTVLSGKTVDISSEARVEYNRVKRMIGAIEDAIATLKIAVSEPTQLEFINRVETAYLGIKDKFSALGSEGMSNVDNITYFIDALASMSSMTNALKTLIAGESSILSQAARIVTSAADFASYNNFLNTAVSSSIEGANEENSSDIGFAGAVGFNDFKAVSEVILGRNVTVKSVNPGISVNDSVKISATTSNDMIGAAGYIIPSSGAKAMGGTFFGQNFDSYARVMIPEGADLIGGGKDVSISAVNDAKTVAGGFSSAMAGAGIQGMFTYLSGESEASVNVDNEADISLARDVKLNSVNNTRVINLAGSVMVSSSIGVAAGFAINNFDKNSIVFFGNIDEEYQNYLDEKAGVVPSTTVNSKRTRTDAKVAATGQIDAQAKSTGAFIAAGVAGGITKNDDSGETNILDIVKDKVGAAQNKITDTINTVGLVISDITTFISDKTGSESGDTHTNPSISLSVAGSGGLNFIDTNTEVSLRALTMNFDSDSGSNLNAIAVNNTDVMAFAGSAGLMFQNHTKEGSSGKSVGIAGAVGLNSLNNNTSVLIKNSFINNADKVNAFAVNGGTNVAAGLGLQVSKNSGNANGAFTMGGSVSLNKIDNNVSALLDATNVTGNSSLKTDVNVAAYESDLQITGGVQVTVGQQKGAFGAAVNVSNINNDVSAKIKGGNFTQIKDLNVSAIQAMAQINGAMTAGVVLGTSNSVSLMGAMIYNQLDNNLTAEIDGASISASGNVKVNAQDYSLGENVTGFGQILNRSDSGVSSFISADGGDYYDVDASNEADGNLATPLKDQVKKGSLIVSGAMAISVADTAVGAGLSLNNIDNNFTARIDNSTINSSAGTVETYAKSDTFMVSAAGGVAASSKNAAAGGSVIWNDVNSEVNSGTTNSVITAGNYYSRSGNDSRIIGIAGQVSAGKGPAIGFSFTYNNIVNSSNAFSLGTKVFGPGYTVAGSKFLVRATNYSEIMNLAATAAISDNVGIGGAFAVNRIDNNTVGLVDNKYTDDSGVVRTVADTSITGFDDVYTRADDLSSIKSIAGGFSFGGTAAVGGAIAGNEIHGTTGATVNNAVLGGNNILVQSINEADIWTMAAGCGGAGEVAVQGASVLSDISRTVSSGLNKVTENKTDSEIEVQSKNTGEINSNATVIAIGGSAGVGAGVAVNHLGDTTRSFVSGGNLAVKNLDIRAKTAQTIRTVGIAGAGGPYAGVSGSVAVNLIKNNTNAFINSGAAVVAENNIGVVAESDEILLNYSGMLTGGLVGAGAGLSVNNIEGTTRVLVRDATVKAKGLGVGIELNDTVSEDSMNDGFIDDSTVNVQYNLQDQRTARTRKGLLVSSSATHTVKSFVANAAVGGVAVAGTVNVSRIDGETMARIADSTINNGIAGGNVIVYAGDFTNLSSFVGSVSAGGGGLGFSSDSGIVNRTTSADMDGIKAGSSAKDVIVNANSKLGISSINSGLGISGSHSVAGTVSVNMLDSNTEAIVKNSQMTLNSLSVNADRWAKTSVVDGTAAVGGYTGVGGAVGVNKVRDKVKAEVIDSNVVMAADGCGKFQVRALNDLALRTIGVAIGGGTAGLAGNVGVNFIETDVFANVKNTNMVNRASSVLVRAGDNVSIDSNLGTVAAGVVGAGVSAGVNILDGKTRAVVDGSKLYAVDSVNVTANKALDISQNAFTAAAGVGAFAGNIIYISSGKLLIATDEDGAANVRDAVFAAEQVNAGAIGETNGALTDAEKASLNADGGKLSSSQAGLAETSATVGKIDATTGSTLDCLGVVNVTAGEDSNASAIGGSGSIGKVAAGGSAAFVNVNRNVGTSLNQAVIKSGGIVQVSSAISGSSNLDMYQGSTGFLGAGTAAYGKIGSTGKVFSSLANSNINANGDIIIAANDSTGAAAKSYGLTAGQIAAGAIVTQIDNESSARVTLSGNTLKSTSAAGQVLIEADRENNLTAKSVGGALGLLVSGTGIASTINDNGAAAVSSTGGTYVGKGKIAFAASNKPTAVSEATSASLSGLVSAGVSVAKSTIAGTARVSASGVNTFNAPEVAFNAKMYGTNALLAEGVSGGFAGSFGYNESIANNNAIVTVLIGDSTFSNKNTKLSLSGTNIVNQTAETRGLNVGGLIASGNNKATAESNTTTRVELTGNNSTAKQLGSLDITADSSSIHSIKADGNGGGLISIEGLSAYAINKMTTFTQAAISGRWKLADAINLFASQNDKVAITADSTRGAALGYSGTKALNTINSTTKVAVADAAIIEADDNIEFRAKNSIFCNDDGAYSASGGGYGGIVVSGADGIANVTSTTEARVGKNARLISQGEISGEALTDAVVYNKVLTEGAGMVANPLARSRNIFNFSNSLITDSGSLLRTLTPGEDVNLAASDNLLAYLTSDSDMQGGLGGYSEAKTVAAISRNNTLDIYGDITSSNDANLYTDANAQGQLVNYTLTATADSYNKHSAVAVAKATIDSKTTQSNRINIHSGADIRTIRHIGLHAGTGKMTMTEEASEYTWYSSSTTGGYASTASGIRSRNLTTNNVVTIDGNIVSGINNKVTMTIGGLVDMLGTVPGSAITPTVTSTVTEYISGVKTGIMDYGNELFSRYQEICNLIVEYDGTSAGIGYMAEKTRLLAEMEKYGLYDPISETVIGGLFIQYVSLPDMVCSGGNIVIDSDAVIGSGNVNAKGAPQISVTNNSNLYMKVNDLSIIEYGGEIIYNSVSLGNTAATIFPTLTSVKTSDPSSAQISVKETWKGPLNVIEDGVSKSVVPVTNIELNGNISNPDGRIVIENTSGDIVMQGATAETSASIAGREIELNAAAGSISQGFSEGILNIGGTPEEIYRDFANAQETLIDGNETYTVSKAGSGTFNKTLQQGTWIAGDSIYLSAMNINVNGLIQSGYGEYTLFLNEEAQALIDSYDSSYIGQNITPEMLSAYKLNDGGARSGGVSTGWVYEVQAYYNPQTKQIILEDINPRGGKVYLTGRIASTGNGRILAVDGSADIRLDNHTNRSLTVGKVNVGDVAGLISITDLETNTRTEFRRDSTTTSIIGDKGVLVSGPSGVYSPRKGQYYNWSTGKSVASVENYYKKINFRLWGGYTKNATTIHELESTETLLNSSNGEADKLSGTYIGYLQAPGDPDYVINYHNDVDYFSSYFDKWVTYSNWLKSRGTEHYKWGSTVGKILTFQHSLKADHDIAIGFIGRDNGGRVQLSANGNINLTGDVGGAANTGVSITSLNGAVEQTGGKLIADNLWLKADKGVGNNGAIKHRIVGDQGKLAAVSRLGNIAIVSNASSGKMGNLELGRVVTGGDVKLTADGSITRSADADALIKGQRIDLVSNYGGIGKSGVALLIEAGQTPTNSGDTMSASVNALARDNIYLEQTSGDMRLGRIESRLGDVDLKVDNGSFDNVLPVADNSSDRKSDELIEKWIAMGLINADGTSNSTEIKARAMANFENSVKTEFASYLAQKAYYDANPAVSRPATYKALRLKYGSYASADAYLTALIADTSSEYYKISNNAYGWSKDNLLYALQKSIMNPTSGSTQTLTRPANVKGKNITLTALNGGIGKDGAVEEVSIVNLGSNLDVLKKLAGAEASDITWKEAEGKATINHTTAIGVEMTSPTGGLTAKAKNNVYLAAATDDPIYLNNINAGENNVRLLGRDGIINVNPIADFVNIKGKDLIIEGGDKGKSSSIGTSDKAIVTSLSGTLTARAEGFINIFQKSLFSPMMISAIYGGGNVKLRSWFDLQSVNTGIAFDDSGYINADGRLTLVSDHGDIGEDGKGVRILTDNLDVVRADANNVFIEGQTSSSGKPALNVGNITTSDAGVLKIQSNDTAVNFAGEITAGAVAINADSVTQNESRSWIRTDTLRSVTQTGLSLDSSSNRIGQAAINNERGDVTLKNSGRLKVKKISAGGDLLIANAGNISTLGNITGRNISIDLHGSFNSQHVVNASRNLVINATREINANTLKGRNVRLNSGLPKSSLALSVLEEAIRNSRVNLIAETADDNLSDESVNDIAMSGGINVHELLADEEIFGQTQTGDIIVATLNGKRVTLVVNHDDGMVNVERAKLGQAMNVSAGEFKSALLEHTDSAENLKLEFAGANGGYMKDISIGRITSDKGVQVDYLKSSTATIKTDTDLFLIYNADLLVSGQFSNSQTSVSVPGTKGFVSYISLNGQTSDVSVREAESTSQSLSDKIAAIVKDSNDFLDRDSTENIVMATESPENAESPEKLIECLNIDGDTINADKLVCHESGMFLVSALNDADAAENDEENDDNDEDSETENKD